MLERSIVLLPDNIKCTKKLLYKEEHNATNTV